MTKKNLGEKIIGAIKTSIEIRAFELNLLDLFAKNLVSGTTHTCVGQEFSGAIMGQILQANDQIFSNHRCHGHFLGFIGDYEGLAAEILGLEQGINNGVGGSQHICLPGRFYSNGILGGMVPFAIGMSEHLPPSAINVIFLGDGSFGEGVIHEALNLANVHQSKVLFFIEDNGIAQSTHTSTVNRVDKETLFKAHNIPVVSINKGDEESLFHHGVQIVAEIRSGGGAQAIIWHCDRHMAHSKGDDTRGETELNEIHEADYLKKLCDQIGIPFEAIFNEASTRQKLLFTQVLQNGKAASIKEKKLPSNNRTVAPKSDEFIPSNKKLLDRINDSLAKVYLDNGGFIIGEDVAGDYGGAFKVTRDLEKKYGCQVKNMPISEAGIIGFGAGLSTNRSPVAAEIMFGDFLGLACDQIINHVAKFGLFHGSKSPRLTVRTPIGGGRGYGATHSQNLEKVFGGIPGVSLCHLSFLHDVLAAFQWAATNDGCTIISEPKLQYALSNKNLLENNFLKFHTTRFDLAQEIVKITPGSIKADVSLVCTGIMLPSAINAASNLMIEDEIAVNIFCPRTLYPLIGSDYLVSELSNKVLIVDESHAGFGFVEHMIAYLPKLKEFSSLQIDYPIYPSSLNMESEMLLDSQKLEQKIKAMA